MIGTERDLARLADRIGQGDTGAAIELRDQLRESLPPIVRFALAGNGSSVLATSIRAVARRVASPRAREGPTPELVEQVVATLCARAVARLRRQAESVRAGYDTVVD